MRTIILCLLAAAASCAPGGEPAEQPETNAQAAPSSAAVTEGLENERTTDSRGQNSAREVLQRYFALVEAGRHDQAAKLWWDEGRAAAFTARLGTFGEFLPSIAAPGRIEGAAGSAYVSISLQLLRNTRAGSESLSDGTAVLRRINDVPGSTEEQRQWRIDRITLQPPPVSASHRFTGRWASEESDCAHRAWIFTVSSLKTPAGSVCSFSKVSEVPGGYDIAASCAAEGPPRGDTLKLRFAQSARALLFESEIIADAGLMRCR
jgi:hypothetical protein